MYNIFFDFLLARLIKAKHKPIHRMLKDPVACQENLMHHLISVAKETAFGKDHSFNKIKNYEDFKKYIPLKNYEKLLPYIERIKAGEANILWKGRQYFQKNDHLKKAKLFLSRMNSFYSGKSS